MNTLFLVCFLVGLSLSIFAFASTHHLHFMKHHGHQGHGRGLRSRLSAVNMTAITAFLTWFGGAGFVVAQTTRLGALPAGAIAVVAGTAGGSIINRLIRGLARSERPLDASTIVGKVAKVTSSIRAGGTGEIVYSLHGTRHAEAARAEGGAGIDKGTKVVVVRHERGIAYVSSIEEL